MHIKFQNSICHLPDSHIRTKKSMYLMISVSHWLLLCLCYHKLCCSCMHLTAALSVDFIFFRKRRKTKKMSKIEGAEVRSAVNVSLNTGLKRVK